MNDVQPDAVRAGRRIAAFGASWMGAGIGFALGVPLTRLITTAARPGQLPGMAAELGFSPRGYLARYLLLVACAFVGAGLATLVVRSRPLPRGKKPSRLGAGQESVHPPLTETLMSAARTAPFAAAQALTAWIFLVRTPLATLVGPLPSLACIFGVSLLILSAAAHDRGRSAATFVAGVTLALPFAFWEARPSGVDLVVGGFVLIVPILTRWLPGEPRFRRTLRAIGIGVVLPGSVAALAAAATMRTPVVVDIFEDGHALLPASEFLRGELPYRDMVPGHGLVSDGLLQTQALRWFGDDYRGVHTGNTVVGFLFWPSVFAMALVTMRTPAAAFGALLLTFAMWPHYFYLRAMPSFWIVTLAVLAAQTRARWIWAVCGAMIPIALCVGVEFAVYGAGAAVVALVVARGPGIPRLYAFSAGGLTASAVLAAVLLSQGILGDFSRTTFVFLPTLLPVYAMPLMRPAMPWPPSVAGLSALFMDRTMFLYAVVAFEIIAVSAMLVRAPIVGRRARAALPVFAWTILAMLSVVARRHINYPYFLVPLGLLLAIRWARASLPWRRLRNVVAIPAIAVLLLIWRPWQSVSWLAYGLTQPSGGHGAARVEDLPRAAGAAFASPDLALLEATRAFIRKAALSNGETWFDFANAPGLYYFFDRNCPIRYYEVPYYEAPRAQQEVIAMLERNTNVRAVLMSTGLPSEPIDGVPNSSRAPDVSRYLNAHFTPYFESGKVVFWLRK